MQQGSLYSRACAMLRNVYFGWWVLGRELFWICGRDRPFRRQQKLLRSQKTRLQQQISAETLTAGLNREKLNASLQLVETDLQALSRARHAAHLAWLQPLRVRFPEFFTNEGTSGSLK